jgi:nitroreductase
MFTKLIKKILPQKTFLFIKRKKNDLKIRLKLVLSYRYDFHRYYKYSAIKGNGNATNLSGKIIREYHVIEKGLTMPNSRLGFGKGVIVSLCESCEDYIRKYGYEEQLIHALGVIFEYEQYHNEHNYKLDPLVVATIEHLKKNTKNINPCLQKRMEKEDYFRYTQSPFPQFSTSRSSVRNYSNDDVPTEKIIQALDLARNTPSTCNRQSWRTYLFINKNKIDKILDCQGGSRGFGKLANKLIVITAELGVFIGIEERNQAFIDGGMYAMNVLYALHYNQIAACILNCSNSPEKDKKLRDLCNIRNSEVFIAMIACGIPPDSFLIANSKRYGLLKTNITID